MSHDPAAFRRRLSSGDMLSGTFVKAPRGHGKEIFGDLGYDFVVITRCSTRDESDAIAAVTWQPQCKLHRDPPRMSWPQPPCRHGRPASRKALMVFVGSNKDAVAIREMGCQRLFVRPSPDAPSAGAGTRRI
jgi:hypothetical protein